MQVGLNLKVADELNILFVDQLFFNSNLIGYQLPEIKFDINIMGKDAMKILD